MSILRSTSPPPVYDAHTSASSLRPYLQLPHLLSLTWLAYPILSLIFVIFRLQTSLSASQDAVANAKGDLLTSCKAAEQAATAAASMPRYMAEATNEQFADAVNGSLNAARAALVLALTVMQGIINFIVDIYRSTFLCFAELVIRGGLAILIAAVEELNAFVQNTAGSIRTSIQGDIATANSAIKTAVDAFNRVNPFSDVSVPQFDIPSLSSLENISLPTTFQDSLTQLNSTLPSFAELKEKVESVLDAPFELLKKDINDTFAGITFDAKVLPIPQQNVLTFCNELDTSVVDDLGNDLIKVAKIGTLILILLALLLLAANCLLEWYKWRCLRRHLQYTREAWISDPTMYHTGSAQAPVITLSDHNLLMLQANGSHPLLMRIANTLSARLRLSPSQHTNLQWFFHYVFHPPALACFLIGFFGLLSVEIQLLALGPLRAKFADKAASAIKDFSTVIATSINNSMFNQSAAYANEVNGRVDVIQSTINNGVFGWVNGTTTTLNNTIAEFYSEVQNAVSTVFSGTILEQPAQEFIKCIIGSKVDAIENALTFMQENLNVDMPRVNQSVLVLSSDSVNEATKPIAAAAIGGGNDDDEGLVGRLVNSYAATLRKERLMFAIFMGLWGLVVLMALCIIFWHSYGQGWVESRRRRRWVRKQRVGIDGFVVPFRDQRSRSGEAREDGGVRNLAPSPPPPNNNPWDQLRAAPEKSELKAEKSWDSFFVRKGSSANPPVPISRPTKLMALGRKALGREGFTSDEKTARDPESAEENANISLLRRITGLFRQKAPEVFDDAAGQQRGRNHQNLRISVDRASNRPGGENVVPTSAWSVSPGEPRPIPWARRAASPSKQLHPPGLPIMPRHNVSVPSSVSDDSSILAAKAKPTPLAMPLHHTFTRTPPPMASPAYLPPPTRLAPQPARHKRMSSVPQTFGASATPVTRLLTTTHARKSSTVDPFASPFDDQRRLRDSRLSEARRSGANPFAGRAL